VPAKNECIRCGDDEVQILCDVMAPMIRSGDVVVLGSCEPRPGAIVIGLSLTGARVIGRLRTNGRAAWIEHDARPNIAIPLRRTDGTADIAGVVTGICYRDGTQVEVPVY
jgi:hypothetical protein